MDLVNIDDDLLYTYWSPEENKYVEHTGTLREFIKTFADLKRLYIYTLNYGLIDDERK